MQPGNRTVGSINAQILAGLGIFVAQELHQLLIGFFPSQIKERRSREYICRLLIDQQAMEIEWNPVIRIPQWSLLFTVLFL